MVVHGDANPGNVLAARREPWLVIDPKPMVGDPSYDLCPLLVQVDDPSVRTTPCAPSGSGPPCSRTRPASPGTGFAAWCTARLVESALWSVSRGALDDGRDAMARASVVDRLSG